MKDPFPIEDTSEHSSPYDDPWGRALMTRAQIRERLRIVEQAIDQRWTLARTAAEVGISSPGLLAWLRRRSPSHAAQLKERSPNNGIWGHEYQQRLRVGAAVEEAAGCSLSGLRQWWYERNRYGRKMRTNLAEPSFARVLESEKRKLRAMKVLEQELPGVTIGALARFCYKHFPEGAAAAWREMGDDDE